MSVSVVMIGLYTVNVVFQNFVSRVLGCAGTRRLCIPLFKDNEDLPVCRRRR